MSAGDDWTHQWILTNMGTSNAISEDDSEVVRRNKASFIPMFHSDNSVLLEDSFGIVDSQVADEGISTSPVDSVDLDRDSPMACGLDDDDVGPPSIETQPPDISDDLEVSHITSTWISSLHPGLGYQHTSSSDPISSDLAENNSSMPGLEGGDYNADMPPVYGPALPIGPYNSPDRESSPIVYGDIADDRASGGLCGLRNLGNTCFMAAGIQCLVNTPPIAQYFFKHHMDNEATKLTLAGRFSQLTHKMWSGNYSSVRPSEFKEAFGEQWREFQDYRQHDCQEFVTLLLEALKKQMPLRDDEELSPRLPLRESAVESVAERNASCTSSSICSRGSRESRGSASPTPPHSPPSPLSPRSLKQPYEMRMDSQEVDYLWQPWKYDNIGQNEPATTAFDKDNVALDSGAASPKSSISSCSVDAHLISLRLQPIPEEVKCLNKFIRINSSTDDLSMSATVSCQDAESVASDMSDSGEGLSTVGGSNGSTAGVASVRRYNHLSLPAVSCDISEDRELEGSSPDQLPDTDCDTFNGTESFNPLSNLATEWTTQLDKNEKADLERLSNSSASNNHHLSMVKLEDIMKETKTSNINVLVKDSVSNNEFLYDSEKYAKVESKKLKNSVDNLNRSGLKRVKEINLLVEKIDNSQLDNSGNVNSSKAASKSCSAMSINKRIRLEEKNVQYEIEKREIDYYERISDAIPSTSFNNERRGHSPGSTVSSDEQRLANDSWKSFVGELKSAVIDTFYGQFKSSLVCCVCSHTSVKFDPFGTLSVPLPHANEIQIPITFVPHEGLTRTRCLLTLLKVSTVLDIKNALAKMFGPIENEIVIAEVFDNHIARPVDEGLQTKFLNPARNIYAYELSPATVVSEQEENNDNCKDIEEDPVVPKGASDSADVVDQYANSTTSHDARWQPCNICLDELCQTDLKTHEGCDDCCLCESCIEMSIKHHGGLSLTCPVCQKTLNSSDLFPVAKRKTERPKARNLHVPVVFRLDTESDNNNKREMQVIGHPFMLHLVSRIKATTLSKIIRKKLLLGSIFTLLFVEGRGYNCSRCLFSSHCHGCDVSKNSAEVCIQAGDTLCVRFTYLSDEQKIHLTSVIEHNSMLCMRQNAPLTIYDCLKAFTQSETLEDSDSWYCPKCELKQQATKTISVWKYPPYLIIHLERFLFNGAVSTKLDDKVIFPVDGLDLSEYVTGNQPSPLLYNLYSCVCHMGGAHAGHYTALVRSPVTGEWHYFNDDSVTRQKPRDDEYSTSYLLFYHRQGTKFDLPLPKTFDFTDLSSKVSSNLDETVVVSSTDSNFIGPLQEGVSLELGEKELDDDRKQQISIFRDNLFEEEERLQNLSGNGSRTFSIADSCASTSSFNSYSQLPSVSGSFDKISSSTLCDPSNLQVADSLGNMRELVDICPLRGIEVESSSMETGECTSSSSLNTPTETIDCDTASSHLMEE